MHYGLPEDAPGQWAFLTQALAKSPATLGKLVDAVPPNEKILDLLLNGSLLDKKINGGHSRGGLSVFPVSVVCRGSCRRG